MLSDALKTFRKIYEEKGDALILDSYIPDDGEYIIVSCDEEPFVILDKVMVKLDKESNDIDRTNQYIDFICHADYYSKYLNSNKSVTDKNIHSNNFLSFYTKIDPIQDNKINEKIIKEYYYYFRCPEVRFKNNKEERILYKEYENEVGEIDIEKVNKIEKWVKENLFKLVDFENKQGSYKKTSLRILFQADLNEYKKEGNRYFVTKIYNTNIYNINNNKLIYGLPDDNMGLNVKKPYLKNLTRKNDIPYYLSQEEVIMQKRLFDYLSNLYNAGKRYVYFLKDEINSTSNDEILKRDFNGIFFTLKKGQKEIEIQEYDNIVDYRYNIKTIKFENILELDNLKSKIVYGDVETLSEIKDLINEIFFNKFLTNNYFTEPKDIKIKNTKIKKGIINNRDSLFTWFYKGIDRNVWKNLRKSSTELVMSAIFNGNFSNACERFNLKMSLKSYFKGGVSMSDSIKDIKDNLKTKINSNETEYIQNDDEYYFAVGQAIYYFISLSKSGNKKLSLANPILNSKIDKKIKEELRKLYIKYNYSIELSSKRFKNLYSMISSYNPEVEVNQDLMIAGFLHSNLIFEKSKVDNVDLNKEEKK